MINKMNIIVRRAPGDERATLGIRTAYAAQAGGYETSLVLMEDGVYNLAGKIPDYLKKMLALFQEAEGRLACFADDLKKRGLSPDGLAMDGVEVLDADGLADLVDESESVNMY